MVLFSFLSSRVLWQATRGEKKQQPFKSHSKINTHDTAHTRHTHTYVWHLRHLRPVFVWRLGGCDLLHCWRWQRCWQQSRRCRWCIGLSGCGAPLSDKDTPERTVCPSGCTSVLWLLLPADAEEQRRGTGATICVYKYNAAIALFLGTWYYQNEIFWLSAKRIIPNLQL